MKQLLLLLTITMATLTANAQAKLYDAFNIKARTTLQLGNKTITEITDDTVMGNKYQAKIMSEWATKKAIENALQGLGVDTNVLATRLRLYKVKDSLSAIINSKLSIADTTNKWVSKNHTINNISNGTGFLKNNGSGTWSYDNNSYMIGSGAANQIPYFVSGSVTGSNSNFKYTSELLLSQANNTQTHSVINASNTFNNLGIRQGQNGMATLFGYQFGNNTSNASDYGNVLSLNGFYDGTNWVTKNGYIVPSMLMLRGNGGLSIFTNNISQAGVAGNFTPTETMTILGNGNVGINQTNPSTYKLDVTGTGRFTSTLKVGAYTLPSVDGTSSQVLKTNGSGSLSWQNDNGISLTSLSASSPLSYNNGTGAFSISQANGSTNGYLSSTDWNSFSNKIATSHTVNGISNGTGFLKNNGSGTWSYDNNNYLTTTSAGTTYLPIDQKNVKNIRLVNATAYPSGYQISNTAIEVVLVNYADPCNVTLPNTAGLSTGAVFEVQWYNWAVTNKTISIEVDGTNGEAIDVGNGISSAMSSLSFKSYNQTGNNVTPLSLRIMWLASDNVWTVLQGGVFDY
jgi:hypothetical protein